MLHQPKDQVKRRNRSMMYAVLHPRLVIETLRQPSRLRVLREVVRGFSKEARTRGFPSPSLGGFGFIDLDRDYACCDECATQFRGRMAAFPPKTDVKMSDLDSVRMSDFCHLSDCNHYYSSSVPCGCQVRANQQIFVTIQGYYRVAHMEKSYPFVR